ncbi:MAG: hypothetical protein QG554_2330, partial [Pseudomonadota bacterium]|nr:hypothetical protein [Pseudomonadota bacterium]
GVNVINACTASTVSVNGESYAHSILVSHTGPVQPWAASSVRELQEAHFADIVAAAPEVVIFGSGPHLRFPHPALLRGLMAARIGFETMDTPAACRTYNVLAGEGRRVMAALLIHP